MTERGRTVRAALCLFASTGLIVTTLACSKPGTVGEMPPASVEEIGMAAPVEVGLVPDILARMVSDAADEPHRNLTSVLVASNGCLALEAYFNGAQRETLHDVRSVAKSVTGTLVGIALHDGAIASLDAPVLGFFGEARAQPSPGAAAPQAPITLRHLLEMRSGLDADDWWDNPQSLGTESRMEASPDRTAFALAVPAVAPPGARWQYSSVNTLLLGRVVALATQRDLEAHAREKLFAPLGFGRYEWRRDSRGEIVPQGNLAVRARDLLKFGLLFEGKGRWQGRRLVPEAWIVEATRARSELPSDAATGLGRLYKGYGYHWWTGEEPTRSGATPFYFASGNGGQRLFIVPRWRLVVVVTSSAYNQGYAHQRAHGILRAILDATEEGTALARCG
jgi:CubicO group peptidase (beta-lactamase class C family)